MKAYIVVRVGTYINSVGGVFETYSDATDAISEYKKREVDSHHEYSIVEQTIGEILSPMSGRSSCKYDREPPYDTEKYFV